MCVCVCVCVCVCDIYGMTFVFVSVFVHFFLCAWQPLVSCPVVSLYWFVLVDTAITCSLFTNSYLIVVDMFVYTHTSQF